MKHLNRLVLLAISANTATAFTAASLYPSTSSPRVRKTTLHSAVSYEMKDIISCASDGLCTVDEMEGMLRGTLPSTTLLLVIIMKLFASFTFDLLLQN